MKSKKGLIIGIILVLIILMAGGAFAYVAMYTDLLKSDEEMFLKYLSKNFDNVMFLQDDDLVTYLNKQIETPYQTSGNIKIEQEGENLLDINTKGNVDKSQNYNLQKITLNYSEDVSTDINYLQTNDYIAMKMPEILKNYLVIENNNLKQLMQNFGITDVENIPDTIEWNSNIHIQKFDDSTEHKMKDQYADIILSKITPEMISKVENENYTRYTLAMTKGQIKETASELLTALQNDEEFINSIKNDYMENNQEDESGAQESVDEAIDLINKIIEACQETSEDDSKAMTISVDVKDKKLINTEIASEEAKLVITYEENKINLSMQELSDDEFSEMGNITIQKIKTDDDLTYSAEMTVEENTINVSMQYEGIATEEPKEAISVTLNDQQFEINYEQNKKFVDSISIGDIPDEERTILNDYDEEQLQQVMQRLLMSIIQLHSTKLQEAGIETDNETTTDDFSSSFDV